MKFASDGLILSSLVEHFLLGECIIILSVFWRLEAGLVSELAFVIFILFYFTYNSAFFWNLNDIFSACIFSY